MNHTTSLTADALASALGDALSSCAPEQYGALLSLIPDTPWTTTTYHVLQRRQGRVFADSALAPRNVVVVAQGESTTRTLDQAFTFGDPESKALRAFVEAIRGPVEVVCDDAVGALVREIHPDARRRETVVHWYERLEDADAVHPEPGPRRLRITEAELVGALVPVPALRTFRTVKELVTGGTCYVIEENGAPAAAAYTVDQSLLYERVSAATREVSRGRGLGTRVVAKVVRAIADQGRIPCAHVDRRDAAGLRLAEKMGFNRKAVMTSWVTSFRR